MVSAHHQDAEEVAGEAQRRHQRMAVRRGVRLEVGVEVSIRGVDGDLPARRRWRRGSASVSGHRLPSGATPEVASTTPSAPSTRMTAAESAPAAAQACSMIRCSSAGRSCRAATSAAASAAACSRRAAAVASSYSLALRSAKPASAPKAVRLGMSAVDERVVLVPREHQHPDQLASLENRNGGGVLHPVQRLAEFGHRLGGSSSGHRAPSASSRAARGRAAVAPATPARSRDQPR